MREWTQQIDGDLGAAAATAPANGRPRRDGCAVCGVEGAGHDPGCPAERQCRPTVPSAPWVTAATG